MTTFFQHDSAAQITSHIYLIQSLPYVFVQAVVPRVKSFAHYVKGCIFKTTSFFVGWFPTPLIRNPEGRDEHNPSSGDIKLIDTPAAINDDAISPSTVLPSDPRTPPPTPGVSAYSRFASTSIADYPPNGSAPGGSFSAQSSSHTNSSGHISFPPPPPSPSF